MKRILPILVVAVAAGVLTVTDPLTAPAVSARAVAPAAELARVALQVEGMTCGGCALSTRIVLKRLDGVKEAEVSYEQKRAIVTYDPDKVTPERMIAALKDKLGYAAKIIDQGVR
ncbi:MAG: heavy-metal-associated domain-containing protein [Longimicrobiaceae bacterium]